MYLLASPLLILFWVFFTGGFTSPSISPNTSNKISDTNNTGKLILFDSNINTGSGSIIPFNLTTDDEIPRTILGKKVVSDDYVSSNPTIDYVAGNPTIDSINLKLENSIVVSDSAGIQKINEPSNKIAIGLFGLGLSSAFIYKMLNPNSKA
jgi:hypothetical protein